MIIFKKKQDLQFFLRKQAQQHTMGFVPTMGALHQGHYSLIAEARLQCSLVVCSIFVNPTQFNDPKDFEKYPITLDTDIDGLVAAGCDVLFLPDVSEMYPQGLTGQEHYNLGELETLLEGAYRPGHFQGVCQIVAKLLQAVQPHVLFLGQKDYQQCMVISRLVQLLNLTTIIEKCNTLREADGLAMSSRNRRLNEHDREIASTIYQTLLLIKEHLAIGDTTGIIQTATTLLANKGFKTDYVAIAHADTLAPVVHWDGKTPILALIAAYLGDVRLIDNMMLNP
jgi:pantoate--beta-alanine ligase